MNTRDRRTKQEYALLLCGQFFRDELEFNGTGSNRLYVRYTELRDLVFDALDSPSMADAEEIKRQYELLKA